MKATEMHAAKLDMSILGLIGNSDIVVKFVIIILIMGSIWSWAIIFDKFIKFKSLNRDSEEFEKIFWSGQMLQQLYERLRSHATHPLANIFIAAMDEWNKNAKIIAKGDPNVAMNVTNRINIVMTIIAENEIAVLGKNLNFLASLSSIAPFIGLFGTVWGTMDSFIGIASAKNTSLAVVAPGIAEALLATGIGLVAAIPAAAFYNILSEKINKYNDKMNNFSLELGILLSRELDQN